MKKPTIACLILLFCFGVAGCATNAKGRPDPIKTAQQWDDWIEENLW